MKKLKILLSALCITALLTISVSADEFDGGIVSDRDLWQRAPDKNSVILTTPADELGDATSPISKGYFDLLFANTATVGSVGIGATPGGILFADALGQIIDDATDFSWDAVTNQMTIANDGQINFIRSGGGETKALSMNGTDDVELNTSPGRELQLEVGGSNKMTLDENRLKYGIDGNGSLLMIDDDVHGIGVGSAAELGITGIIGTAEAFFTEASGSFVWATIDSTTALPVTTPTALMQLDNNGRLGLGTLSPRDSMEIKSGTEQNLLFRGAVSLANGSTIQSLNDAGSADNGLEYRASTHYLQGGNVGIGKATPDSQLHIYESSGLSGEAAGMTVEQGGSGDAVSHYELSGGQVWSAGIVNDANDYFSISPNFQASNSPVLTLEQDGDIGIGRSIDFLYATTPPNPVSGDLRVYSKNDDELYSLTSSGIESRFITEIPAQNVFTINEASDFPAAVGGKIPLVSGVYNIRGAINVGTDQFVIPEDGNVRFVGYSPFEDAIVYTGTGDMYTSDGLDIGSFFSQDIAHSCPSGTFINLSSATPDTGTFVFAQSILSNCGSMGLIDGLDTVLFESVVTENIGDGLILRDNNNIVISTTRFTDWQNNSTDFLKFEGTQNSISIHNCPFEPQSNEYALHIDSASVTNSGIIVGNQYITVDNGRFYNPAGKNQSDLGWTSVASSNVQESQFLGAVSMTANANDTDIGAIDTPAKIEGTWNTLEEEGFTTNADGTVIYDGIVKRRRRIFSTFRGQIPTGVNITYSFYVAKGNSIDNIITVFADAGGGNVTVTSAGHGLSNGDRVVIRNTTNYNSTYTISSVTTDTFQIVETFAGDDATGDWALILEDSVVTDEFASGDPRTITLAYIDSLDKNDCFELFAENNTNTTNITIDRAKFIID